MTDKKIGKINIPPKQKIKHTCCVSCKKYTGNRDMSSKTINNKVKLLKSKCLKCKYDKSIYLKLITCKLKKEMLTYCLRCKKHTDNICPKN